MRIEWMALGATAATLLVGGAASALPLLSEVYYDAVGSDDGQIFVEIVGLPGTPLEGYFIDGVNGSNGAVGPTIALEGAIGTSGLFVVADRTTDGSTSVAAPDQLAQFDFQNGPDSVVLRRGDVTVDALGYGVFDVGEIFAGEGTAAPDAPAGSSLARTLANLDTDDNAIDWEVSAAPSPGTASFAPIPEPGTALLLGLGLSGLAAVPARRRGSPSNSPRSR